MIELRDSQTLQEKMTPLCSASNLQLDEERFAPRIGVFPSESIDAEGHVPTQPKVTERRSRKGLVIGDLHLGTSIAKERMVTAFLRERLPKHDAVVFLGDTFDITEAEVGRDEAVLRASRWLESMLGSHPECRFLLVLGNHEEAILLRASLERLQSRYPNLTFHDNYVRLGGRLFIHGDGRWRTEQVEAPAKHPQIARWGNLLYRAVSHIGIAALITAVIHNPARHVPSLLSMIQFHLGDMLGGISEVFFGHTHHPVQGHTHAGLRFHNPGAPIIGAFFRPLSFEFQEEDL